MGQALTKNKRKIKNKKNPKYKVSEEYFIRNGGVLLEKQLSLIQGHRLGEGQLKILSNKDIEKATNNYDPDLFMGNDAHYTAYRATIDDRAVAIKVPSKLESDPKLIDFTLTAASTVTVMNHSNVIKLYGCCLETCIPILVFDIPPCQNLFHQLHVDNDSSCNCMKWTDRLRIATGTAYALSYMHNALSKPVVHRNVKSRSVIYDNSFNAILANFGHSVSITPGEKPQKLPVEGTPGYIDPEYVETHEVTDKCDVYSFGVLLLELLTRRLPSLMIRNGTDLVSEFVSRVEMNCMMQMIDREVVEQASRNEIQLVAQLAMMCVSKKGVLRPTMIEVVTKLWLIQGRGDK